MKQVAWVKRYSNISLEEIYSMKIWEWKVFCEQLQEIISQENKVNGS